MIKRGEEKRERMGRLCQTWAFSVAEMSNEVLSLREFRLPLNVIQWKTKFARKEFHFHFQTSVEFVTHSYLKF